MHPLLLLGLMALAYLLLLPVVLISPRPRKPPRRPYGKRLRADRRERMWRKRMRRLRGKPWLRAALREWRRRHPRPR